jgi:nucleoside-diphosphate-sugar epimerase
MSVRVKVLITSSRGLIGGTLKNIFLSSPHPKFEVHFLSEYICRENVVAINSEIRAFSPEIIIHNAAKLPRGNRNRDWNLRTENNEIFDIVLNSAKANEVRHILAFTTYHIFETGILPPFHKVELRRKIMQYDNWYSMSKFEELVLAEDFNQNNVSPKITFIMLPHMFGIHDNFEDGKRHFVADNISKISIAKVNNQNSIKLAANPKQLIQLADAEELIKYIFDFYLENLKASEFVVIFDGGVVITLEEAIQLIASLMGYSGKLEFSSRDNSRHSRDMYFRVQNSEKDLQNFISSLKSMITQYKISVSSLDRGGV